MSNERSQKFYEKGYKDALRIVKGYYDDLKDWGIYERTHIEKGHAILKYNKPKIEWKWRKPKFVLGPGHIRDSTVVDYDFESYCMPGGDDLQELDVSGVYQREIRESRKSIGILGVLEQQWNNFIAPPSSFSSGVSQSSDSND